MTPIQKRNYLERIGFEFLFNGNKIDVFRDDNFIGTSKEYKNSHDALIGTEAIFYERYKDIEKDN